MDIRKLGAVAAKSDNLTKQPLHTQHFLERQEMNKRQAEERKQAGLTKRYATKEQCARAMTVVLDSCEQGKSPTAKAAFRTVGIPEEHLKEVLAHKDYHFKSSVAANQYHPAMKRIEGCANTELKEGKTLSQTTTNIKKAHNTATRLDKLETEMAQMKTMLQELKEVAVDARDIAKVMKANGRTQVEVAERTGKGIATIKRWWKDI